ncbi:MAG: DUF3035 domain-containing protein [Micavibrio aeruginosavorus]|uniref:DUF3035 domain-containing protein n=1 Tax=Micavibrio aeruginosavorus TaxID=349221 RepID=A0A7T5R283_9BACT|nr:MAG: DUF3035 domain-containing protein [Micavibrio aeruginosavorus]
MRKTYNLLFIACLSAASLTACSNAKETLGLARSAPDEFAVVKRAPLEMPPDYSLRPPRPGAPRPQEQAVGEQARETVFGGTSEARKAAPASGESALLQQAGATQTDPNIRTVVDRETALMAPEEKPVAERLLGIKLGKNKSDGSVIDPEEEAARLKAQQPPAETP